MTDDLEARIYALTRPSRKLLWLYLLRSFFGLVFQPLVFLPLFFKYETLRFDFQEKGVRVAWGILFRREVFLTYGRIQDIHVTSGLFERWLGLGTVSIQTASGSAGAELSIEGLTEYHQVRDFLYQRMRGVHDAGAAPADRTMELLGAIRDELKLAREALERRHG